MGLDLGTTHAVRASAGRGGVDVVLHGNSHCLHPSVSPGVARTRPVSPPRSSLLPLPVPLLLLLSGARHGPVWPCHRPQRETRSTARYSLAPERVPTRRRHHLGAGCCR